MTKRPARKPPPTAPPKEWLPHEQAGLTAQQYEFCLEYLANGFNGSAAYKKAYVGVDDATARANASRLLANANVAAFIQPQIVEHWKALQMDGEEALARIALLCTLDLADFFDENHCLKSPQDWPARAGQLLESVDWEKGKVKIGSRLQALRTLLEVTGKIKNPTADDAIRDLATILAEKFRGSQ